MMHDPLTRIMGKVRTQSDGHWIWEGSRCGLSREYGQTSLNGVRVVAHRAVWRLLRGEIPAGLELLHQCGRSLCVNPEHLRLGTHRENILEAVALHGAWSPVGEANASARLTWRKVAQIRERAAAGETQATLAREYGVSQPTISHVVRGLKWKLPS
jgi:hypothetical protein